MGSFLQESVGHGEVLLMQASKRIVGRHARRRGRMWGKLRMDDESYFETIKGQYSMPLKWC